MSAISLVRGGLAAPDLDALHDIAPAVVGTTPFGVIVGVTAAEAGLGLGDGLAGSFAIYSGSAQMSVFALLASGAGTVAILLSVALTSARLMVYGAALAPAFRRQPAWFRWLAPQVIIDQTYAIVASRDEVVADPRRFRRYWFTAGAALTLGWLCAVGLGVVVGPILPPGSPLEVAMPALFIGLTAPKLRDRRARPGAVVAAAVAAACIGLPRGSGVIIAIIAGGIVAAMLAPPSAPAGGEEPA